MFFTYLRRELRRRMRQAVFVALGLALGVGLTMVLVTHDSTVARRAQRIGVMRNGRPHLQAPRPRQKRCPLRLGFCLRR